MDPNRERTTLIVELAAALLLGGALAYTGVSAASEARSPGQLRNAAAGRSYPADRPGQRGLSPRGRSARLPRARPQRTGHRGLRDGALRPRRARPVPAPGRRDHRHCAPPWQCIRGREGLARHKVPVEVQRRARSPTARRRPGLPLARPGPLRLRPELHSVRPASARTARSVGRVRAALRAGGCADRDGWLCPSRPRRPAEMLLGQRRLRPGCPHNGLLPRSRLRARRRR